MRKRDGATLAVLALALGGASGEEVFRSNGCGTCHSLSAAGIEAKVKTGALAGPELGGAIAGAEDTWLRDVLHQKVEIEAGRKHPKPFKGSDEELSALIAWLKSLSGDGS